MTTRRGRGRPSHANPDATREALVAAARQHFAERGFAGATLRAIAADAGVDASLISHYFGDKSGLLVATMELPFNPVEMIRGVLEGPLDGLGERLIRGFCGAWDPHVDVFASLVGTLFGGGLSHPPVYELAKNVMVRAIAERIGDEEGLRASLIASQMVGLGLARYVVRLEPLASASVDDIVDLHAASVQRLIST